MHPIELLGDVGHVESDLVHLEIVLILTQDRRMVYAKPTICLEVILDTSDRTLR